MSSSDFKNGEWTCGACTMINQRRDTKCTVCLTNKGTSSRKNASSFLRQEQEAEMQRVNRPKKAPLEKKPREPPQPREPKVYKKRSSSTASKASSVEDGSVVETNVTVQGITVTILGHRDVEPGFGRNDFFNDGGTGAAKFKKR